jgi:hypothetical protein
LTEHKLDPSGFSVQIAVYRNYNVNDSDLLESSPWETQADNLRNFMATIVPKGGIGNEAVEIGFLHANEETDKVPISQIILIGDAPANTRIEVVNRMNYYSGLRTKYTDTTYWEDELNKLIQKGVPVYPFYVDKEAKDCFDEIARRSGTERAQYLAVNSSKGSQLLLDTITKQILIGAANGDSVLAEELVNSYRKAYT